MLAASLTAQSMQELLSARGQTSCEISCFNGPSMTVVSGKSEELESVQEELKSKKLTATRLQVQYGFHSQQMEPIMDDFESVAKRVHFAQPKIAMASTLTGTVVTSREVFNAEYLTQQMRRPVDFLGAARTCESEGLIQTGSVILESGPHPVCLGLVAASLSEAKPTSFGSLQRGQDDWKSISACVAGAHQARLAVNWQEFHKDYLNCVALLDLPTYAFDLKNYWVSYQRQAEVEPAALASVPKPVSDFSTTCLQKVEDVRDEDGKLVTTFTSHTSEPNLFKAIQGHVVDGVSICPAAVFADMAYTATWFLLQQSGVKPDVSALELVDLEMTQALVVSEKDPDQVLRVAAVMDEAKTFVSIRFSSSTTISSAEHGACQVLIGDEASQWRSEWSRVQRLVKGRVDSLATSSSTGVAHRMKRALVYKLFANLVDYDHPYQALEEVHIDESFEDAAAHMNLSHSQAIGLGSFTHSPYAVDALVHLAGFVLNADLAKPSDDLHIANHIGSMRIIGDLSQDRKLTCYTAIREQNSKGVSLCDVYVFEGSALIAVCTEIRFQKLTRAIFGMLTGRGDTAISRKPVATKPSPQVSDRLSTDSYSASSDSFDSGWKESSPASSQTSIDMPDPSTVLLEVVADRIGVDVAELDSTADFGDMGVDSPMSFAILTDFKKRTGTELPAAFFTTFPTVADLREELGTTPTPVQTKPATVVTTPAKKSNSKPNGQKSRPQPSGEARVATKPSDRLLRIVASELGISQNELTPSADFASAGVDSILSIKILSIFKKETGSELPAAFFNSNSTVAEAQEELDGDVSAPQPKAGLK